MRCWHSYLCGLRCKWFHMVQLMPLMDWVKVLCPNSHKIGHFRDVLPSQSLGLVLKNLNLTQEKQQHKNKPECGPMPNLMATRPNIGGAVCESSVILFLVPHRKVWLRTAAGVPCSNAANIGEHETWTQSEFCTWQNSVRWAKAPKNIVHQLRRQPKIVQNLVGLCWATSLQ